MDCTGNLLGIGRRPVLLVVAFSRVQLLGEAR